MGKMLKSPATEENALPKPRDSGELGPAGTRHGMMKKSPETAEYGINHRQKTPDQMGTLFGHKPDKPGV